MITIFYRDVKKKQLEELKHIRKGAWIQVEKPTEQEFSFLIKELKLDAGLLQDAVDIDEVPRLEVEDDIVYIFTRFPIEKNGQIETMPIMIAIGERFVLTLSTVECDFLDEFIKVGDFYTTQKTKLFLQISSRISLLYTQYLTRISRHIRSASLKLEKIANKDIIQFVTFEMILNDFLIALVRNNTIFKKLLSGKYIELFEDDRDLVEDLFLNNEQQVEISKENLSNMVNIREAYSTIMTNNLNNVMKLFASLTILLTIPTIIASIFGMNVHLPLQDDPRGFFFVIVTIVILLIIGVGIFVKNKWL